MEAAVIAVSDILKLLDQIPVWRTLKAMPGRLDALERRIADLETGRETPHPAPGEPCPGCGAYALRRTSSQPSATAFGALGAKDEIWTCQACGETDERIAVR